jgi:hypothetical protein
MIYMPTKESRIEHLQEELDDVDKRMQALDKKHWELSEVRRLITAELDELLENKLKPNIATAISGTGEK